MKSVMRQIVKNEGIVAAGHRNDNLGLSLEFRVEPLVAERLLWEKHLNVACDLLDVAEKKLDYGQIHLRGSDVSAIKVVVGEHVWNIQKQGGDCITIVSIKGHPVTKSLQRLVRRGLKKVKALSGTTSTPERRFVPRIVENTPDPAPPVTTPAVEESAKPPAIYDRLRDDDSV